jgi:oligoribonuclease (3'-5' exoribonuclease)
MVKQTHVPFKGLHFRKVRISTVKELAAALKYLLSNLCTGELAIY